jgi:hypothetical protein
MVSPDGLDELMGPGLVDGYKRRILSLDAVKPNG